MFYEDAEKAAPVLNIALTVRNKKANDQTKMCGVPHHSVAGPIGKLLSAGFKVAVCDQVEPADQAKGLVKREVTRVLTPGMVYDPESLDQLSAHYLCAFDDHSVSFTDTSTGEAFFYIVADKNKIKRIIHTLSPVEMVLTAKQKTEFFSKKEWEDFHISVFEEAPDTTTVKGSSAAYPVSARRLLAYVKSGQGEEALKVIRPFEKKHTGQEMQLSSQAREHLELFKTYHGDKKDSLFSAVNRAKTPPGARLLKSRLRSPSVNQEEIEKRLSAVRRWTDRIDKIEPARALLTRVGDMERKIGKISHPQCSGGDLLSLAESLKAGLELISMEDCVHIPSDVLDSVRLLMREIKSTIRQDAPVGVRDGHIIQKGVSKDLDQLVIDAEKSQSRLSRLENQERIKTGIPSLKVRYNNVFGYYIEVTKAHFAKVPSNYIRKQTLTQAERYTTEKLQEMEEKILSARGRRVEMEFSIFENLRQKLICALSDFFYLSRALCEMDVSVAFAYLAIEQSYVRPCFSADNQLVLVNSRHPVVEQKQNRRFVPNTIRMKYGECLLLTGPNMAGKSTLMRQIALSVILAQAGSFVPAEDALLPVFTKLFTRIGASDSLSQGLSTFMVEMKESVEILNQADENSLIILDEIGRGTATYDGMSLAQAILEYLMEKKKSLVFFATHYHELTQMAKAFPQVRNAHLSVSERDGQINFLYTLKPGALAESYGIHVARLAGFPKEVVDRAEAFLKKRERGACFPPPGERASFSPANVPPVASTPFFKELIQEIQSYPLKEKSPLETMNRVEEWKQEILRQKSDPE